MPSFDIRNRQQQQMLLFIERKDEPDRIFSLCGFIQKPKTCSPSEDDATYGQDNTIKIKETKIVGTKITTTSTAAATQEKS